MKLLQYYVSWIIIAVLISSLGTFLGYHLRLEPTSLWKPIMLIISGVVLLIKGCEIFIRDIEA